MKAPDVRIPSVFGAVFAVVSACSPPGTPAVTTTTPVVQRAEAVPSTDIYLYQLSRGLLHRGQRLVNLTNRPGYDNQPAFVGSTMYYTSGRDGQADIYRFANAEHTRFTNTSPESEYSAALTPDGRALTVVRVERDSTQRLWRFPLDGSAPSVVIRDVKPVGYFAWLDSTTLALFVLGNPNTLRIADARTGAARVVTPGIGRSLQRVPGGRRASFVQRDARDTTRWMLKTFAPDPLADGSWDIQNVALLPDSADYVVWRSEREAYTAAGSRIYRLRRPGTTWEQVVDLSRSGIRRISRLALHPNGRELALVAEDQPR